MRNGSGILGRLPAVCFTAELADNHSPADEMTVEMQEKTAGARSGK
jgi:hypothetical protein